MSISESTLSQASTKVSDDTKDAESDPPRSLRVVKHAVYPATTQDVLLFLLAFRILNALTIRSFFQPDEYFQSLEPAWQMAFGKNSGAWITWEWRNYLRSAIHPAIFGAVYWVSSTVAQALQLSPSVRNEILLAAPKTVQAVFAGLGDYYTWKLAEVIHGRDSSEAWAALALTVVSPWQWFCSTRTLSNCLETTLTVLALYNWPWHWSLESRERDDRQGDHEGLRIPGGDDSNHGMVDEITLLRRALLLAAFATIMRPTNILIWATLSWMIFLRRTSSGWLLKTPWTDQSVWIHTTSWSFVPRQGERVTFIREILVCGTSVLLLSILVDRFYYHVWSLPPLNFLRFNVVQSLSLFYGDNDWHYYLSQGYPLLLTTALPFTITGIYQAFQDVGPFNTASLTSKAILSQLAAICLVVPFALSLISHKEVRFIYPLLPAMHILSASSLTTFFGPSITRSMSKPPSLSTKSTSTILTKRTVLFLLIAINAIIALYTSTIHNSGVISVMDYLRHQHSIHYLPSSAASASTSASSVPDATNMTVAFLMPCHSTPWRSHLIHPSIHAWALTCEPPIHLNATSRATYVDEADVFYADPALWLRSHMSRHPPRSQGIFGIRTGGASRRRENGFNVGVQRDWPDYLVFFAQLESVMHTALQGSGYKECWRTFNSHWHDDWRRKGDVVVWCVDKERKLKVEEERRRTGLWTAKKGAKANQATRLQKQHHHHESKTGGGVRGLYGMGGDVAHQQHRHESKPTALAGEPTVERPFWKKREKIVKQADSGPWSYLWPFGKQGQKDREGRQSGGWQREKWS